MKERHDNDKIEPHNHNKYPLLYKEAEILRSTLGRFLEVEYISYNVGTQDFPDIYARALGLGHIYQANPSWPCYNYYIYTVRAIKKLTFRTLPYSQYGL